MPIKIPAQNKWYQSNNSDILGNLYATKNINLEENKGTIRLGQRLMLNTATEDVAEINSYPVGFRYFNNGTANEFYTIAGASNVGYVFKASSIDGAFAKVTTSGAPAKVDSTVSDIEIAFGVLYVSCDGKLYFLSGSNVWDTPVTAGSSGYFTSLCYFPFTDQLYCSKNGNLVQEITSTHAVSTGLTLPSGTIITFIRATSTRLWIGTINQGGGKGVIYEWDGSSASFQNAYRLDSGGALACVIKDDIPYCIDANGDLIFWNGGTFKTLTGINRKKGIQLFNPFYATNQRFIHPNGMSLIGGKIHCLLDLTNYDTASHNGTQEESNPSGIWVYDEDTNSLTHKYSFGLTKEGGTISDYGQFRIFGAGGLSEIITAQAPITTNGTFLAGCSYYTSATVTTSGIFFEDSEDLLQKAGYFVTTKIFSSNITEIWQKIYLRFRRFLASTDKIVVKARNIENVPTEATITYTSTTTFTTPTASFTTAPVVGDEVEILQGVGAGRTAHITVITTSAPNYAITVDETITGATTQTAKARFQTWKKLGSYNAQTDDFIKLPIPTEMLGASSWIQFKVWVLFTGKNELYDVIISLKPNEKIE